VTTFTSDTTRSRSACRPAILAALMLGAAPAAMAAQEPDTIRLREIVVTATRAPVARADAPGTITVLTGDDMRERGQRFVIDALRTVPGVSIARSAGPGSLTSLFVRGGESDYVQVLVDGVQVNDPGGALEWAHLRAEDIERIEIVRGPASVLYGSDAVAGVIQIFTRAGGAPTLEAALSSSRGDKRGAPQGGAFDSHAFDGTLSGAAALGAVAIEYGASGSHFRTNGLFERNSDYDNSTLATRLLARHPGADLGITARYTRREYHYPTSGSGAISDINEFATGDTRSFGIDGGVRIRPRVELRAHGAWHDAATGTDDPPDHEQDGSFWSRADQLRRSLDARVNVTLPRAAVLTVGAEREWQEAQTAYESVSDFGTFGDETDESRVNTGAYAQLHAAPLARFAFTLGGRIDDNERFGTAHTGRVAVNFKPSARTRIHAAAGTAFKEPTFFENYATGFTRGNPDLDPERSRSWEAGVEHTVARGAFTFSGTYFDQRFRNLIQYTAAPAPDRPNYQNVGSARAHGLEIGMALARDPLTATASYTYTATRVADAGFGEDPAFSQDRRLLRRPEHQIAVDAIVRLSAASRLLLSARHTGERDDLDFTDPGDWAGTRTMLASYAVVDAALVWTVPVGRGEIDATVGARNLLDADYQEIFNFPTPGRVLHVGLRARLGL
jgi:vitamin B12 transporter